MESEFKVRNVIDMAITVAAMTRVFESKSKQRIARELQLYLDKLKGVKGPESYERLHSDFCAWFKKNIWTAEKKRKGKVIKKRRLASYGHGAKIFDIAAKVYVHYCQMPDVESARHLTPLLHGAIDNPILKYLKGKDEEKRLAHVASIAAIDKRRYEFLQALLAADAVQNRRSLIAHEDFLWWTLNRKSPSDSLGT